MALFDTAPELLREAVVYLVAAVVFIPLFTRLKLGAVLGYLAAGVMIGPQVLRLIVDPESALAFAEFGVVLLLFVVGLELNPGRLWALRHNIFGLGTLQVVVCGFAIAGALLLITAFTWQAALVVGLALALSSTALDLQLLKNQDQMNTPTGERVVSILLMQDLAIVPLLLVVTALSRLPDPSARSGWELIGVTGLAIVVLTVAGKLLLKPLFSRIAATGTREVFVIGALLTVVGASFLMAVLGVSMAMGAFIAGVLLAESPYRHEVEADIEPFRGLLLGLFFMAVGMTLDLKVVFANPGRILLFVLVLVAVKTLFVTGLSRLFGSNWREAGRIGILLSQGGEFGFVVLAAATHGLLIYPEAASLFTAVVTVSMASTPLLLAAWGRVARMGKPARTGDNSHYAAHKAPDSGRVIVIGYGRFGQIVTQMLHARGLDVVLIDSKPDQIERSRAFGWTVYYGDGFRPDVLRAAGVEGAQLLLVTSGGAWDPHRLDAVRAAFPHLKIIARAHDRLHYMRLVSADVHLAVRELFHSALQMGRMALAEAGTAEDKIDEIMEEFVRRDRERLALQIASGDVAAGRDTVFRPGEGWTPAAAETSLGEIPPASLT